MVLELELESDLLESDLDESLAALSLSAVAVEVEPLRLSVR